MITKEEDYKVQVLENKIKYLALLGDIQYDIENMKIPKEVYLETLESLIKDCNDNLKLKKYLNKIHNKDEIRDLSPLFDSSISLELIKEIDNTEEFEKTNNVRFITEKDSKRRILIKPNYLRQLRCEKLKIELNKQLEELKIRIIRENNTLIKKREARIKLLRGNCVHYAVENNHLLKPRDIHRYVYNTLGIGQFQVKRIIKKHSFYIRLSINKKVDAKKISEAISALRIHLDVRMHRLRLTENLELKNKVKKRDEETSILTLNINKIKNKIEELNYNLNIFRPSIICLQETGIKEGTKNIHINGYKTEESKFLNNGLGLLIGIRHDCNLIPKVIEKNENMILFSIKNENIKFFIANIYKNNKDPERSKTKEDIIRVLKKYEDQKVIIIGDWNQTPEQAVKQLETAKLRVFAEKVPKRGTRVRRDQNRTNKTIDFAISNQEDLIKSQIRRRNWNLSDHVPVNVTLNMNHKTSSIERRVIFDRELLKNSKIIKKIINQNFMMDNITAELAIEEFNSKNLSNLKELKVIREEKILDKKSILPEKIKKMIKIKNETSILVRNLILPIGSFHETKKNLKRSIIRFRRRRYINYIKKGIEVLKTHDHRNAWRWIKTQSGVNKRFIVEKSILDKISGELIDDPIKKMEIWSNHFKELCKKPDEEVGLEIKESNQIEISNITDSPIIWEEIEMELKCTRNYKAAGDDNIPSEFYKTVINKRDSNFAKAIIIIFNKILNEGICPKTWENCTVIPIYKKGDKHDTNNYRGIALINTMQKLIAKILAKRLQLVCSEYSLLNREQAGFIKTGECTSQVATLLECCQRRKFRNQNTILCFLDLKKAYDMVPHIRLINKLINKGLGTKFIGFIKKMYENTKIRIGINDLKSHSFNYERGVRQGCPTSPLLFNIYIDDLINDIKPIEVEHLIGGFRGLMFADDTVIAAESFEDLTEKLDIIKNWMEKNSMELNPSKCGIMVISDSDNLTIPEVKYNNEIIPQIESYIYLGINFNNRLDLQIMSDHRVQKGIIKCKALAPSLRNTMIPLEYKKMLINNIIIPTVSYGSEIFGMSEKRTQNLKKVIDTSISCILNTKNFCRNRAYEEFDLKPIQVKAAINRTRGYQKWKDSFGLIRELISTSDKFKSRKSSWTKGTNIWLKRFKINVEEGTGREEVLKNYISRIEKRDKTEASKVAKKYRVRSGKLIRRLEVISSLKPTGTNQLMKLRTGTFAFTNRLVFNGRISNEYINKCICCKETTKENIEHILLECRAFEFEREKCLGISKISVGTMNPGMKIRKIQIILGGDCPASGKMPAENMIRSTNYLSALVRKRAALIAEAIRTQL